jgi:CDK-activating kinase assembly factor MAT1
MTVKKGVDSEENTLLLPLLSSASTTAPSLSCPICKADSYLNKNLKLLVSTLCCHRMCETCVYRLFSQGIAPCPVCGTMLKKTSFSEPQFEDLSAEKEYRTRKRLMKWFNKRREDFEMLEEYNDYLEEVEQIIFNLVHQIDVEKTNEQVERYKQNNQELILKNNIKQNREDQALLSTLEREKDEARRRRELERKEMEMERLAEKQARVKMVDELAAGEKTAEEIIGDFQMRTTAMLKKSSAKRHIDEDSKEMMKTTREKKMIEQPETRIPVGQLSAYLNQFGQCEISKEFPFVRMAEEYDDPMSHQWKADPSLKAGGYPLKEVYLRALEYAFAQITLSPL